MKKIMKVYYKCELCGSRYDSEYDAENCEMFHKKNLVIKKCLFDRTGESAMPLEINVVADDGTEAIYELMSH